MFLYLASLLLINEKRRRKVNDAKAINLIKNLAQIFGYIIECFSLHRNKLSKSTPSQFHQTSSTAMKKKSFDFPDHHYRDAISRLKTMLSDSYAPPVKYPSTSSIFKSVTDDETDTTENTIIERPAFKEVSKYFSYKPYSSYSNISSSYGHNKIASMTSQNLPVPCESIRA